MGLGAGGRGGSALSGEKALRGRVGVKEKLETKDPLGSQPGGTLPPGTLEGGLGSRAGQQF